MTKLDDTDFLVILMPLPRLGMFMGGGDGDLGLAVILIPLWASKLATVPASLLAGRCGEGGLTLVFVTVRPLPMLTFGHGSLDPLMLSIMGKPSRCCCIDMTWQSSLSCLSGRSMSSRFLVGVVCGEPLGGAGLFIGVRMRFGFPPRMA